jgi:hypothetical protein
MNDTGSTHSPGQTATPGLSVILIIIGAGFALLGLAWGWEFLKTLRAGSLDSLEEWRAGAYALTYLAAGAGMVLHARWAAWAVAAWGAVTVSQFIYPPAPREQVPLFAQVAVALIVLFWTAGLTFYVRRRTRAVHHDSGS